MNTIALIPPKPPRTAQSRAVAVELCTSCDKPINDNGECRGCTR